MQSPIPLLVTCGSLILFQAVNPSGTFAEEPKKPRLPLPKMSDVGPVSSEGRVSPADLVSRHYVTLAHARYTESLEEATRLFEALKELVNTPSGESHRNAKDAWIRAHRVYSSTEVFRFGNPNVDAWETRVNAWPVDEGFLDYVSPGLYAYEGGNPHAFHNLIASDFQIAPSFIVEARSETDPKAGVYRGFTDNETNVATGYHAIEFLLWGQDLNRTPKEAGKRPFSDYVVGKSGTGGNNRRRGEYLLAIGGILLSDLNEAIQDWTPGNPSLYAESFLKLPVESRLDRMLLGMGGLSNGELAGERIQVALLASDQEEEQSCFSDSTHLALLENARSVESIYLGRHERRDGKTIQGPSLSGLVMELDADLDRRLRAQFEDTREAALALVARAETVEPFDQMILADNEEGRRILNRLINALKTQTEALESIRSKVATLATLPQVTPESP